MKKMIIGLSILILIVIGIIIGVLLWPDDVVRDIGSRNSQSCIDLGCGEDALYVGSINSDKYYVCDCHYTSRIFPENIICFTTDEDAVIQGYIKREC